MTRTLEDFCNGLMADERPMERLMPEELAAEFAVFFGLSGRPALAELGDKFERAGIGQVSPAPLPDGLRGVHYTLPDGSYAIHYREDQWEGSSEYTVLHEGYEIVYETVWHRCRDGEKAPNVCPEADRFAAAVLMPPDIFAAYARASGLDVAALHQVFRCSYASAAIRLAEVVRDRPLMVVLYEREERGDPAGWTEPAVLRAKVVKRTAGLGQPRSPLLNGWRGGIPRKDKPLSDGSLAERAARSGRSEYAEGDGLAVVATPVYWKGRLAKVIVAAVPWEHREVLEPQLGRQHWRSAGNNPWTVPGLAAG